MVKGWCDIPVERIIPAPWNYKGEDETLSTTLRANLRRNGQVESVIVRVHPDKRGFFEMVNGNHRLAEFAAAGITTVHAFNLGKVTQEVAARIAIETNDTRFQNDPVKLAGLLDQLQQVFPIEELHATLPFSTTELDNYAGLLRFDWGQFDGPPAPPPTPPPAMLSFDVDPELLDMWEKVAQLASEKGTAEPPRILKALLRYALGTEDGRGWLR